MTLWARVFPINRWLEPLLALAVAAGLVWSLLHLYWYGYLPQPYFYEPNDVWMDWFNTAYWSHEPGAYDSWKTIYPPLSFAVLKGLTFGPCYPSAEGYAGRSCDVYGAITLHGVYFVNVVLTYLTFRKIDRSTAIPRSFALVAGLPMTYGLERGNLILLCFTCVLLAFGPLVKSARVRWVFAGLAINFKVYLIGMLFGQLLRQRWRWFEGAMLATAIVYLISFAIVGAGSLPEIYNNIVDYSAGFQSATVLDLWYPATYKPLLSLIDSPVFPIASAVGSRPAEVAQVVIPALLHATQGLIILAALATLLRPTVVPRYRLVFLTIAIALITSEAGGYTQILMILFVFMEPWRGFGRKWAIVVSYILCIPADYPIDNVPPVVRESFLSGRQVVAEYAVGIGPFLRPGLIMSLAIALALVTIFDVCRRIRQDQRHNVRNVAPEQYSLAP